MSRSVLIARSGRFAHIDAMRAFAVMLVVVAHTNVGGIPGGSGVTMFFTISGFIITWVLLREREKTGSFDLRGFYLRRFWKLFPPFLVAILLPTVAYWALGFAINWAYVSSQTFFYYNWASITQPFGPIEILPGSSVVWSLSIEEQFYLVFALAWLSIYRLRRRLLVLTIVSCIAVVVPTCLRVIFASTGSNSDRIYEGTDTRVDAIAIGVLAAIVYKMVSDGSLRRFASVLKFPIWAILCPALYLASLLYRDEWFRDTFRFTIQAAVAAILILWGLLDTTSAIRRGFGFLTAIPGVQLVGLASYSIYLVHAPINRLIEGHLEGLPRYAVAVILILAGTGTGILIWRLVEKTVEDNRPRILDVSERLFGSRRTAIPAEDS